jgi:hypothetical protein
MEGPGLLDNHALELIGGLEGSDAHGSPPWPLVGAPLSLKLIELIRQQDPAPGRRYTHIKIAFLQKLLCLLDGGPRRHTAEIDPAKLIVAADQVMQFGRSIHAGMPRPTPTKEETAERSAAGRSGRPGKTAATEAPSVAAGAFLTLSHR